MKAKLNREWHIKHRMPANATLEQRVKWHDAQRRNCACRPVPPGLIRKMKEAGMNFKPL
ncbi:MAG TPA: hypothetical protein PK325_14505 [Cyclobacteriaceae bacterium]|nr:hypothetical protein [Cyclobacteriaceae bacterium]HMV08448.1 hypothetical protein [Cyclobacteriaceae bacterium]HMV91664.1 hypothetical protein [Cyclobacteriaceae bacterium]HMX01221.1 hypothetical protein [Cyclobacteriaceae bacterium]HMX50624.1 hypothetical protein [Cyclobacteriaceae bacterium]